MICPIVISKFNTKFKNDLLGNLKITRYKNIWNSVEKEHNQNIDKKLNDRVLIIDGLNTFIRCWSSIPTMNDDGEHVGGVTGVLKSIGYAIRNVQPTRVVVVFDGQGGSLSRKKKFSGYKAQRAVSYTHLTLPTKA